MVPVVGADLNGMDGLALLDGVVEDDALVTLRVAPAYIELRGEILGIVSRRIAPPVRANEAGPIAGLVELQAVEECMRPGFAPLFLVALEPGNRDGADHAAVRIDVAQLGMPARRRQRV